jgi:pimeloyl-ACP methyl ester carboxylesterase
MDRPILLVAVEGAPVVFRKLVEGFGSSARPVFHDIELGRKDKPPPGWTIDMEVAGIARAADSAGLDEFDLIGYSGGAAMSLAFLAAQPGRVRSVTLAETPWIGNDIWSEQERSFVASFERALTLPPAELVPAVFDLLSPEVELPADPSKTERMRRCFEPFGAATAGRRWTVRGSARIRGPSTCP